MADFLSVPIPKQATGLPRPLVAAPVTPRADGGGANNNNTPWPPALIQQAGWTPTPPFQWPSATTIGPPMGLPPARLSPRAWMGNSNGSSGGGGGGGGAGATNFANFPPVLPVDIETLYNFTAAVTSTATTQSSLEPPTPQAAANDQPVCAVCLEPYEEWGFSTPITMSCGHRFHQPCVEGCGRAALSEGKRVFCCPLPVCKKEWTTHRDFQKLGDTIFTELLRLTSRDKMNAADMTPAEIEKLVAELRAQGMQRCPSCKHMVQKTEGCDHMRCRCGAEFCYACGGVYRECPHTAPPPVHPHHPQQGNPFNEWDVFEAHPPHGNPFAHVDVFAPPPPVILPPPHVDLFVPERRVYPEVNPFDPFAAVILPPPPPGLDEAAQRMMHYYDQWNPRADIPVPIGWPGTQIPHQGHAIGI